MSVTMTTRGSVLTSNLDFVKRFHLLARFEAFLLMNVDISLSVIQETIAFKFLMTKNNYPSHLSAKAREI